MSEKLCYVDSRNKLISSQRKRKSGRTKHDYLGVSRLGKSGISYTCIEYTNRDNLKVRSEKGEVFTITAKKFNAKVFNDDSLKITSKRTSVIGKRVLQKCGLWAEVVNKNEDGTFDVKFDSGIMRYSVGRASFYSGNIKETEKVQSRSVVGKRVLQNNGVWAEVVKKNKDGTVNVKFDSGVVRKNVDIQSFNRGYLSESERRKFQIGSKHKNKLGMKYTIIDKERVDGVYVLLIMFEDNSGSVGSQHTAIHRSIIRRGGYYYLKDDPSSKVLKVYFDRYIQKYIALIDNKVSRKMVIL